MFKFPYIILCWAFSYAIGRITAFAGVVRFIAHLKSSLSYLELTGNLALCSPPNQESATAESATHFVPTLPRAQILWSPKECARKSREQGSARFRIVTSNCFPFARREKASQKCCYFYILALLLRSVLWASFATEQGFLVWNFHLVSARDVVSFLCFLAALSSRRFLLYLAVIFEN